MIMNCIICSDHLGPSEDIYVTHCGHAFHQTCLLQWLERSKSCPQCRATTTENTIFRIYFNFLDTDADSLQVKLANLEFQSKEKNKIINQQEIVIQSLNQLLFKLEQVLEQKEQELKTKETSLQLAESRSANLLVEKRILEECLSQADNEIKQLKKSREHYIGDYVDLTTPPKLNNTMNSIHKNTSKENVVRTGNYSQALSQFQERKKSLTNQVKQMKRDLQERKKQMQRDLINHAKERDRIHGNHANKENVYNKKH